MALTTGDLVSGVSAGLFQNAAAATPSITTVSPSSGSLGTRIVVVGTNFGSSQGNGTITIGGKSLDNIGWSDTRIVGDLPAGIAIGLYDLVVYNDSGAYSASSNAFIVSVAYANQSARTKLREAIKWNVQQITAANGYRSTVWQVYDPPKNIAQMSQLPACNLYWGRESNDNDGIVGNNQLLDVQFSFILSFVLSSINDPALEQDKILADVQQRFGKYFYIPGSDGNRTAFNCIFRSSEPWSHQSQTPRCGIDIEIEVWYRLRIDNPDVMQ